MSEKNKTSDPAKRNPPERKPPKPKPLHPIAAASLTNRRRTR